MARTRRTLAVVFLVGLAIPTFSSAAGSDRWRTPQFWGRGEHPLVAANARGDQLVTWLDPLGGHRTLALYARQGRAFTGKERVPGDWWNPRLAMDRRGNALLVESGGRGIKAYFRSRKRGWGVQEPAVAAPSGYRSPVDLAFAGDGRAVLATTEYANELAIVTRSASGSWDAEQPVAERAAFPSMASGGGRVVVLWSDVTLEGESRRATAIRMTSVDPSKPLSAPITVTAAGPGEDVYPQSVAVGPSGDVHVLVSRCAAQGDGGGCRDAGSYELLESRQNSAFGPEPAPLNPGIDPLISAGPGGRVGVLDSTGESGGRELTFSLRPPNKPFLERRPVLRGLGSFARGTGFDETGRSVVFMFGGGSGRTIRVTVGDVLRDGTPSGRRTLWRGRRPFYLGQFFSMGTSDTGASVAAWDSTREPREPSSRNPYGIWIAQRSPYR